MGRHGVVQVVSMTVVCLATSVVAAMVAPGVRPVVAAPGRPVAGKLVHILLSDFRNNDEGPLAEVDGNKMGEPPTSEKFTGSDTSLV